jgi:nicotinamide-nucleotide amidase
VQDEVRRRLGNFILAEDDETLEGNVLAALAKAGGTLAVAETFTGGQIAARLVPLPAAAAIFRRGAVARDLAELPGHPAAYSVDAAEDSARAIRADSGASHALAVLVELDDERGGDRVEFGATIYIAIVGPGGAATRRSRIIGGRDWVRLGAVEMGLDCLRRHLLGLPVAERIDFEKVEAAPSRG